MPKRNTRQCARGSLAREMYFRTHLPGKECVTDEVHPGMKRLDEVK